MAAVLRCCGFEFSGREAQGVACSVSCVTIYVARLMIESGVNLLYQHFITGNMNQLWLGRAWLIGGGSLRVLAGLFILYLAFQKCGSGSACYDHFVN